MSNFNTGLTSDLSVARLGKPNGFAPLGPDSKVPASNLPAGVASNGLILQGVYNASTNTPDLTLVGNQVDGHVYIVEVAGTQDIGNGSESFSVGDTIFWSDAETKWYHLQGSVLANEVVFDNTTSGLTATLVQTAIDELAADIATVKPLAPSNFLYVRADGNDSNNGFTNDSSGALLTIAGVEAVLGQYNWNYAFVNVNFDTGNYAGTNFDVEKFTNIRGVALNGNYTDTVLTSTLNFSTLPSGVNGADSYGFAEAKFIQMTGWTVTRAGAISINAFGVTLELGDITFLNCTNSVGIKADRGGVVETYNIVFEDCAITNINNGLFGSFANSLLDISGFSFAGTTTMPSTGIIFRCQDYSVINSSFTVTYPGTFNGTVFSASRGSSIIHSGTISTSGGTNFRDNTSLINLTTGVGVIDYDNSTSGLTAVGKENAIDELASRTDVLDFLSITSSGVAAVSTTNNDIAIGSTTITGLGGGNISIGNATGIDSEDSILIGRSTSIGNSSESSTIIGFLATVGNNSAGSFALGGQATIGDNANGAVQIGIGTNNTANTLQFASNRLANAQGLYTSHVATNYTPADADNVTSHFAAIDAELINLDNKLTGNLTIYVTTTGNDTTGDGTVGNPFLTISRAITEALNYNLNGFTVTVNVGAGTFAIGTLSLNRLLNNGNITILGAGASNTFLTISSSANINGAGSEVNGVLTFNNLTLSGGNVLTFNFIKVLLSSVGVGSAAKISSQSSSISCSSLFLNNGASSTYLFYVIKSTLTFTGSLLNNIAATNYTTAFIVAETSLIILNQTTTGTLSTGKRFDLSDSSHIKGTAAETSIPGNVAGTFDDSSSSFLKSYDNTTSGLTAVTKQAAIDEIEGRLDTAETKLATVETNAKDDQLASEVPVTLSPTNYTAGSANVESHLTGVNTALGTKVTSYTFSTEFTTGPITAVKGEITLVNPSAPVTVNPPASPVQGDRFTVINSRANANTNNITISFASQLRHGANTNRVINTARGKAEFMYVNTTIGWIDID